MPTGFIEALPYISNKRQKIKKENKKSQIDSVLVVKSKHTHPRAECSLTPSGTSTGLTLSWGYGLRESVQDRCSHTYGSTYSSSHLQLIDSSSYGSREVQHPRHSLAERRVYARPIGWLDVSGADCGADRGGRDGGERDGHRGVRGACAEGGAKEEQCCT